MSETLSVETCCVPPVVNHWLTICSSENVGRFEAFQCSRFSVIFVIQLERRHLPALLKQREPQQVYVQLEEVQGLLMAMRTEI